MPEVTIKSAVCLKGQIHVPGDKSISHRALLLSAIAEGTNDITGLSTAQDVKSTIACLQDLGIEIEMSEEKVRVHGKGKYGFTEPLRPLNVGNSGTSIRLLSGLLAAQDFTSTIDGDESLRSRPMRRIIEPLENMGANIESNGYKAPLTIRGAKLRAIDYASPVASAQVKSCIILAGLYANGITRVTEPTQSRDHTERMLGEFGAHAQYTSSGAGVRGPVDLKACTLDVPGDISGASFFLMASCLLPEAEVIIENVGVNPTRIGILDALAAMGANIHKSDPTDINNEPRATITAKGSKLHSASLGGSIIPRIIDEIPILAVAATQAEGVTTIRDAAELRVKESDRIATIAQNLKRMGAQVRELKDGLTITGPARLKGAEIDCLGDHRIAMSFAIAGLIAEGETIIKNAECADISFPGFFDILEKIRSD